MSVAEKLRATTFDVLVSKHEVVARVTPQAILEFLLPEAQDGQLVARRHQADIMKTFGLAWHDGEGYHLVLRAFRAQGIMIKDHGDRVAFYWGDV